MPHNRSSPGMGNQSWGDGGAEFGDLTEDGRLSDLPESEVHGGYSEEPTQPTLILPNKQGPYDPLKLTMRFGLDTNMPEHLGTVGKKVTYWMTSISMFTIIGFILFACSGLVVGALWGVFSWLM